ncbi:MAG TPA: gamma-glutamyl-gamma-aminobutyrate hydrolase family protein [Anaerolineae bacterium]|nr:gamma-glutamyl-gamma-aminobutyrate hydrolase family protein [Anaerolineae bacterium]
MAHARPIIGLNARYERHATYSVRDQIGIYVPYYQALLAAGALPIVIPNVDDRTTLGEYLDRLDGFLFTGGPDVPPQAYGQPKHPQTVECDPKRFACDRLLAELVRERGIPVLAICLGMQLLNVAYGGTLIQHLETSVRHAAIDEGNDSFHSIVLEEDSLLHHVLGSTELEVNSAHHQAVDRLAPRLRVLTRASDGIVEAVQKTDRGFFLGVQWHPERILDRAQQRAIFAAFVEACHAGS